MSHLRRIIHHHQDGIIKTRRSVMKTMEIEDHGDARIGNG
jgi:hypothetical protein